MTVLQFMCKKRREYFYCAVGRVSFFPESERPRFEKKIVCPKCGDLSMDEAELTEFGQTQLTAIHMSELNIVRAGGFLMNSTEERSSFIPVGATGVEGNGKRAPTARDP